jgi:nicotinamidase-related amidase
MTPLPNDTVLIVIDVQQAFNDPSWGRRNNPDAEYNIAKLLAAWRNSGRPLIHVHHRSPRPESLFHPSRAGFQVKEEAEPLPGEAIVYKDVNSSFIGTDLEQQLRSKGTTTLVIAGITTDHCVSTTARMAGNLGFSTHLVGDATATFERTGHDGKHFTAEQMHETALTSLHGEFATVLNTTDLLSRL